jgi:CheY-like chemotaxis protein
MGTSLEDKLRALRQEFLDGLPARVEELERWRRDASLGPEVLGRLCHRLRGLAPMHGLAEVGRLAATIEDKVRGGASRDALGDDAARLVLQLRAPTERVHDPLDPPLQPLRGYRVVAIDDDASMRRLLLLTLRDLGGADATVVEHEADFVAALERGPADLIIADVMMPTTTGPALLARAEAAALLGPARIVVLSGSGEAPDAARWTRLSKPFRPDELVGALTEVLRGAR